MKYMYCILSNAVQCNIQEKSGEVGQGHLTGSCPSCTGGGRGGNIGVVVRQISYFSNHFTLLSNIYKIKNFFNAFFCQYMLVAILPLLPYIFVIMQISHEKMKLSVLN